ncbi:hypothetical protein, partial [Spirosoma sp.]|uniref:hypothetical protein n=1 Tax=Spirosoma sp. TaxID=1899569 RepID=UPI003B3B9DBD
MQKLFTLSLFPGFLLILLVLRCSPGFYIFVSQIDFVASVLLILLSDVILVSLFIFSMIVVARLVSWVRHSSKS